MTYFFVTVAVTVCYAILGLILTPVAAMVLRPAAWVIGQVVSAPVIADQKLVGDDARLYASTGVNFFLMLMMFVVYGGLAWLATTRFDFWSWPVYALAVLFSINYWVNIAGRMPAWRE
jgi:hypothetical protein